MLKVINTKTFKVVKYYDYIHKGWRYIEVNDEVYRYFDSLKKQRKEKRKSRQRLFEESAVAFGAIKGIEESPFCEDKRVNVIKEAEDREFAETVWNVVGKLGKEAQAMLVDRFKKDMSYICIAIKYGKSKSNVSQIFDTLFHHLRLLFMHDVQFLYTDYAQELKHDYLTELKSVFDEIKDEVLGDLFGGRSETIKKTMELSKKLKQEFKIYEKLKTTD